MIFFSAFMMWSFFPSEYQIPGAPKTGIFRPLWDSINFSDFVVEIWGSLKFFVDYAQHKPNTHSVRVATGADGRKYNFAEAFGVEGTTRGPAAMRRDAVGVGSTDEENVRLEPYPNSPVRPSNGSSSVVYDQQVPTQKRP
jgi:hypothetical protein